MAKNPDFCSECIEDIPEDDDIDDNVFKDQDEHDINKVNNNPTEAFIEQVIEKIEKLSHVKAEEINNNLIDAQDNLDCNTKRYSSIYRIF